MHQSFSRVVIFGATSAIAAEVAALLAARGARLFLVGRDAGKLAAVERRLGMAVVGIRVADLNDLAAPGLVEEAAGVLGAGSGVAAGFDLAVIAQGWLGDQLETERDGAHARAVLETNLLSAVALLVPIANMLEAQGAGHVVVLSSVAGLRGRPRNYTYGAAKAGLTVYLQGLRTRLLSRGVQVSTILLGPVDTPMTASHGKHLLFGRPDRVAAEILRAVDRGGGEVFVPWFWRYIMAGVQATPEFVIQRLPFLSGR
jgi:short-subunit dehydrogenase